MVIPFRRYSFNSPIRVLILFSAAKPSSKTSYSDCDKYRMNTRNVPCKSLSYCDRFFSNICCFFTFNNPLSKMKFFLLCLSAKRSLYISIMRIFNFLSSSVSNSRNSISAKGNSASMSYSGSNSFLFTLYPVNSEIFPSARISPGLDICCNSVISTSWFNVPFSLLLLLFSSPPPLVSFSSFNLLFCFCFLLNSAWSSSVNFLYPFPRTLLISGNGAAGDFTYSST